MPFNWKDNAPEVYNIYLGVMEDTNTPKGLSKTALLNRAEKICEENEIKFPYLKKKENNLGYLHRKPKIDWANRDEGYSEAFKKYQALGDEDKEWDKDFRLSDMNNILKYAELIPTDSVDSIVRCMKDSEALGLKFTRRMAKWVARLHKVKPPLNNVLSTSGVGLSFSLGVEDTPLGELGKMPKEFGHHKREKLQWVFGLLDIAIVYARDERRFKPDNPEIQFDSSYLDKIFLFDEPPINARLQLDYYFINRHLDAFVKWLAENNIDEVESRKAILGYQLFDHFLQTKLANTTEEFNLDYKWFLNIKWSTSYSRDDFINDTWSKFVRRNDELSRNLFKEVFNKLTGN